jgi:hypothetical protein
MLLCCNPPKFFFAVIPKVFFGCHPRRGSASVSVLSSQQKQNRLNLSRTVFKNQDMGYKSVLSLDIICDGWGCKTRPSHEVSVACSLPISVACSLPISVACSHPISVACSLPISVACSVPIKETCQRPVISTEAAHGLIVSSAVEKSASLPLPLPLPLPWPP